MTPRIETATGIREDVYFFGNEPHMFGCTHAPPTNPSLAVVICSSLHAEFVKNYRREVLVARSLARSGIAVHRFHYRGTGNSYGEPDSVTFESMRADGIEATEYLSRKTGLGRVAFLGVKWGGLIAAALASTKANAPLALWDPILEAGQYFRGAFRAKLMQSLSDSNQPTGSSDPLLDELKRNGSVEVLGYEMHRALYESGRQRTLISELRDTSHPVLIVQLQASPRLRQDYVQLVANLEERGNEVDTTIVGLREAWWFAGERWQADEDRDESRALIESTTSWFQRVASGDHQKGLGG